MQQKRLIIALLISTAILFLWSYLVPPVKPPEPTATPASQASPQQTTTPAGTPVHSPSPLASATPGATAVASDAVSAAPHRVVSVKTPLYEAKLDTLGAEAVSWIIKKNKDSGQEIYSVAGDKKSKAPLELVSQEGLKRQPREAPLQLAIGDSSVDNLLSNTNYLVEGLDNNSGDAELTLAPGEKKRITFLLSDKASGLDVTKTLVL